jgi:hypothetical protein
LPQRDSETWLAAALTILGLALTAALGQVNPEGVHHFDDLTHYLIAKWAWTWPAYLFDDWGRPGFTIPYFLPAGPGWWACRLLSAILTAAAGWFAFRIAQGAGTRHAWAIVPLCYAQPLFFQLSQTTLTETVLAFDVALAVYLAQRGRWSWSAVFVSLATVTRHEAFIFIPLWLLAAWRNHASLLRLWPLVWAPLLTNVGAMLFGTQPAILRLLAPRPSLQYGQGGWLTFFSRSMEAWGPGIAILAMAGLGFIALRPRSRLAAATIMVYFLSHTAIRALGFFDSGGYARFLVPISPLVAVAALNGWLHLWSEDARRRRGTVMLVTGGMIVLWIAMERQLALYAARLDLGAELPELHAAKQAIRICTATLVVLAGISAAFGSWPKHRLFGASLVPAAVAAMILLTDYRLCRPLARPEAAYIIDDLRPWLADHGLSERKVVSANIWVTYATGDALPPHRASTREQLRKAPVGTLFVWEAQFAPSPDHNLKLDELLRNPAFRLIHETRHAPYQSDPYLRVFEKIGPWPEKPIRPIAVRRPSHYHLADYPEPEA